ncbi:MAG: family 16 glycoside hydrolase [Planctomycetota bacterium]
MALFKFPRLAAHAAIVSLFASIACVNSLEADFSILSDAEKASGWTTIFDGESFDGWRNYQKDSVSDGWAIEEGAMVRKSKGAGDLITDKSYRFFELSLEYKISEGGNSGLMFHVTEDNPKPWHSGPEVQIQDNFAGHDPQKAGWLYQLYKPVVPKWVADKTTVDATRPTGEWNQLYLRISPTKSEVCVNGVVYYKFDLGSADWKKRVSKSKFAKFDGFGNAGEGHICLQDHGDLVSFRNVKLREIEEDGSVPQPINGELGLKKVLAYPNLKWEDWEPVDENGRIRPLRLMDVVHASDGTNRLYAVSQVGAVWSFENRSDVVESTLVLDLRGDVKDWKSGGSNEQGLLGLAFHPEFESNKRFFVYYSKPDDTRSVISEFRMSDEDPSRADRDSERIILEVEQPFRNHNGGSIEFGPDGFLYCAFGDGGDRNDPYDNGQNLSNLLGTVSRIDVDHPSDGKAYGIPADNPFTKSEGARPEIYAYGLRNPWRMSFDPATGELWVADVGQELWEEINLIVKGGNYGWNTREGFHPFGDTANFNGSEPIDPVWEYDHQIGKSITGGRVYRSDRMGQLTGKYVYADYVTGRVWALDVSSSDSPTNELIIDESVPVLGFGQDQQGEVLLLTNSTRGECIYRFDN